MNLVILVRLTISVSNFDNERNLRELRFEAYKDIVIKLNGFNRLNYTIEQITTTYNEFEVYHKANLFLVEGDTFKIFAHMHIEILKSLRGLRVSLQTINDNTPLSALDNAAKERLQSAKTVFAGYLISYQKNRVIYTSFLQKLVLNKSVNEFRERFLKPINYEGLPNWIWLNDPGEPTVE